MNIIVSRLNNLVEGINISPTPLSYSIQVSDELSIVKAVDEVNITILDNPSIFTAEDVLNCKYKTLLDNSEYEYIIADMFLNEDDIDLADAEHSANTGIALLQLLPNGQAKTKIIELEKSCSRFEVLEFDTRNVDLYINDFKMEDKKVVLPEPVDTIIITFKNASNKLAQVTSYAIVY